ncbi:MAG: transglutaminase family protein [Intestinibacillus sp.]
MFALPLLGAMLAGTVAGCSAPGPNAQEASDAEEQIVSLDQMELDMTPLADTPAVSTVLTPEASGTLVAAGTQSGIDYSNAADGYIMVRWLNGGTAKIKAQVTGPSGITYTYDISSTGEYETLPLSDGNGSYKVTVLRNTTGNKYAITQSANIDVRLNDEFAPFLRPNQYVNFKKDSKTVAKAAELVMGKTNELQKVAAVYNFVVSNISYDKQLAATVKSGYLPDVDAVLARKKGICFDYAALMTAMLRSQEVPTKLVIGYTGSIYHAWINVYSGEKGWVNGVISFDGKQWKLMDPTFASSSNSSKEIMKYIGDGTNYQAKYLY